jgi:ketosteroid isomerase-like protein
MNSAKQRLLVTVGLLLTACAANEPQGDTEEIRQVFDALHAAYVADDVDAITSFYEEDAVRLPAGLPIIRGLATIRERMVRSREQTDVFFDDIGEPALQRSGDLAVTYSTYDERRISKASGEVTRQVGQWLLVWRRQADGTWKVSIETWTVEAPD